MKRNLSWIVVPIALAVVVGLYRYVKSDPEIVFNVPMIGWLLWIGLGGSMPPFFDTKGMTMCVEKEKCPWLKHGDVVVPVCAKCGTHWLTTLVHEVRTWNRPDLKDFSLFHNAMPFAEFKPFPGVKAEDRYHHWGNEWNNTEYPFRIYASHLPAHVINSEGIKEVRVPVYERPDVRYIVGVRNPYDAFFSLERFVAYLHPAWRKVWGDLPALTFDVKDFLEMLPKQESKYGQAPEFFKTWYPYKDLPNVLLLHYSDTTRNPRKTIKKVAEFLGMNDITEKAIDEIETRIGIKFMKTRSDKYNHFAGKNHDVPILLDDALVHKGGIGSSKAFKEEQKQLIKKYLDSVLDEELQELLNNGWDQQI